jgi:hypothetical protein
MNYYRLAVPQEEDVIVRTEGRSQQEFVKGKGWVESGIMLEYFWPESDMYNQYSELTEEEALKAINS